MIHGDYRVLVVDDEEDLADELARALQEDLQDLGSVSAVPCSSFAEAEDKLAAEDFDAVVLDVADQSQTGDGLDRDRGRKTYSRVSANCWIPVVFYTGYVADVEEFASEGGLVQAVAKGNPNEVVEAVRQALRSDAAHLARGITRFVSRHTREFLRDHVAVVWAQLPQEERDELPLVLLNRLAAQLKDDAVAALDEIQGAKAGNIVSAGASARVYLYPPVTNHVTSGDLLVDENGERWLVVTPACDLYEDPETPEVSARKRRVPKVHRVRLAHTQKLLESPRVADLLDNESIKNGKSQVIDVLRGKADRYYCLPRYLAIPDLIVDLEHVRSEPLSTVRLWKREATLDSPYAEAVLVQHARFMGRVGVPDLSHDGMWDLIEKEHKRRYQGSTDPTS